MNDFSLTTQYKIKEVTIEGKDVVGLFKQLSVYENIFRPIIAGSVVIADSDGASFVSQYKIEGNEPFAFTFTNALGEELAFKGYLNGLRSKSVQNQNNLFTFDFTTEQVQLNESQFVTKRFNEVPPEDLVKEMLERVAGEGDHSQLDIFAAEGEPISFVGSRKRPLDVVGFCMTHSVMLSGQKSDVTDNKKAQTEESVGSTGALCWQTLDGYRFVSIDDLLAGKGGNDTGTYEHRLANCCSRKGFEDQMKTVVSYEFDEMGDMQTKMRSGAFRSVNISMDLDKGLYKEIEYVDKSNMTPKQETQLKGPTRYTVRPFMNEKHQGKFDRAEANQWDKSRKTLAQNNARQNTFSDQHGTFTLPPSFTIRAGDTFDVLIPKVESENGGGYNEKHSGKYIVKQVGHHILSDGRAYTKIKTIRATNQQSDSDSQRS